ncbi:hypothetical protein BUALT_Bualt16G0055200 [Buddleja alternifolia]|uniref:Uncharacterized protein n=1 Tax=Buddleja alternifolia TaxID=168488 RepID=A0AAV6WFW8_9LAMI|nr:hypothetical protein BUALT_Bualt16G0055200 [Buddleja alternifolia]
MKKSKILKSSKDMLSRSFNPSKCKTSLRLAGSRLKLLKNKKEVQVKQMKREIAQLLESGQDQTARIRVEHVIREEKMMAAYDLIEIYCELIVARLPIIESQKTCPIDLKEAITSVIFASPRCGDVPELLDVRKHFMAKYGKDFTTAAIELRPDCGVGRMLVEKLSAVTPDGQTKIKILSAIAEEHNVKWDQKSSEEKDSVPPSDLLRGPSTFGKESKLAPGVQASQSNNNLHDSPLNFSPQDHINSLGREKLTSAQTSSVSTTFQPEARLPGGERAQHLFLGDSYNVPLDRQQRWNMEFKDATSAAQAAAESAEMASMAARAAAELSSRGRIMRQYSTESHNSDDYILKNEGPGTNVNSKLASEQFSEESANRLSSQHSGSKNERNNEVKPNQLQTDGRRGKKEYNQSASLKSKSSIDGEALDHSGSFLDGYSRKNSLKEVSRGEMSTKKESFKYKAESETGWSEKSENFIEERRGKQPSDNSSRSHSSISDDVNVFSVSEDQKVIYDAGEDPFMSKEGIHGEATWPSSHESPAVAFDNYDSDSELHKLDVGPTYDDHEPEFHWPSSGQKSPKHLSINTDYSSPRSSSSKIVKSNSPSPFVATKNSSPHFSKKLSIDGLEKDVTTPVRFDDSDGPSSESEEEMNVSRLSKHNQSGQSVGSKFKDKTGPSDGSPLKENRSLGFDRKQLSLSSDDDLKPDELYRERNQGKKYDSGNESGTDSGEGLNFQKLTGGLHHKGYNQPPYLKNRPNISLKKGTVGITAESPRMSAMLDNKESTPHHHTESDSDSSEEEEYFQKSSAHEQELYNRRAGKEVNIKPSVRASNIVFGSDNSDSDDDPPKESLTRKSHLQSGISRRTKASASTGKNSYSKTQLRSESLDFDDISETPKRVELRKNSTKLENSEQPTSAKLASKPVKSNYWGPPEPYNSAIATSETKIKLRYEAHDSDASVERKPTNSNKVGNLEQPTSAKVASKATSSSSRVEKPSSVQPKATYSSSRVEKPSSVQPKTEASVGSSKNPKAAALNKTNSNKEDKKASHVHPKLPDYDSLVQSLRMNRS